METFRVWLKPLRVLGWRGGANKDNLNKEKRDNHQVAYVILDVKHVFVAFRYRKNPNKDDLFLV